MMRLINSKQSTVIKLKITEATIGNFFSISITINSIIRIKYVGTHTH